MLPWPGSIFFIQRILPENKERFVNTMSEKEKIKQVKKARREQTKNLDLRTRVATTEKNRKDPKVARRKWKHKGQI